MCISGHLICGRVVSQCAFGAYLCSIPPARGETRRMLASTMARSHIDLVDLAKFPERSMARTTTVPGSRILCMRRRMSFESGASRDGTTVVSSMGIVVLCTNERVQPRLLPQPLPMMVSQGRPCSAMPTQRSVVACAGCKVQTAIRVFLIVYHLARCTCRSSASTALLVIETHKATQADSRAEEPNRSCRLGEIAGGRRRES